MKSDSTCIYCSKSYSFSKGKVVNMGSCDGSGSGNGANYEGILSPMGPPLFPYLLLRLERGSGGSSSVVGCNEATGGGRALALILVGMES